MKAYHLLTLSIALLCMAPAQAQTVDLSFGNLYGADHFQDPNTVTGGTGIGASLVGQNFLWVCLDQNALSPDNAAFTGWAISTDSSALTTGIWDTVITTPSHRDAILTAVKNMYYNYESQLIADISGDGSNNTFGTAFQMASWYFTTGYENSIWNGTLDSTAISNLLAWDGGGGALLPASGFSLITDMLNASLDGTLAAGRDFYVASPGSPSTYQGVALFVVPEPGSALLIASCGILLILRRRRWTTQVG